MNPLIRGHDFAVESDDNLGLRGHEEGTRQRAKARAAC
jgi:hypothetical protein